jgi:hypothetical protein
VPFSKVLSSYATLGVITTTTTAKAAKRAAGNEKTEDSF